MAIDTLIDVTVPFAKDGYRISISIGANHLFPSYKKKSLLADSLYPLTII